MQGLLLDLDVGRLSVFMDGAFAGFLVHPGMVCGTGENHRLVKPLRGQCHDSMLIPPKPSPDSCKLQADLALRGCVDAWQGRCAGRWT